MVNTQLKILRVFGPTGAEVSSVLRGIRDDGCPGLRLLERDGEFAICVQVSAPNRAMAEQYCEKWAARLRTKFGDDVFAEGETSLAQATLDALLEKRKLLVAVDETTGRLLGALLQPLPHSEAVFDFGTESYADAQKARRIAVPEQLLKRFPGDVVQAAAGRALAAMQVTGADFAAAYMPASVGQCPFVLVCDRRGAVACALPPDMNDTFIGNQILDLLRRRLFGLQLTDSCITFRPGHDRPLLVVSEAAKSRGNTVRFSLRRRTPPTRDADHTADFEPMLDFDAPAPVAPPPATLPAAGEAGQHRTLRRLLFWLGWLPGMAAYLFILRSTLIALCTTFMYLFWPALCGAAALALKSPAAPHRRRQTQLLLLCMLLAAALPRLWLVQQTGWRCGTVREVAVQRITTGPAAGTWADEKAADMQECLYEALAPYAGQPVLQAIGEQHGLGFLMADGTLTVAQASVISGTDSDPRFEQYYAELPEKQPRVILYDDAEVRDMAAFHTWLEQHFTITDRYTVQHGTASLQVLIIG